METSSSDNDDNKHEQVPIQRINLDYESYSDANFITTFRLSKDAFDYLFQAIGGRIRCHQNRKGALSTWQKLMVVLR